MSRRIDPGDVARAFRDEIRQQVQAIDRPITLAGLLVDGAPRPSHTYARYTERGCEDVGIRFDQREVDRFDLEDAIIEANADRDVHGIMVYYPVFGVTHDNYLKDQVDFRKDVEGLSTHWLRRLYRNVRADERGRKPILPCTPLSIFKLLEAAGAHAADGSLTGKTATIFNRSEVVGRPLAHMMANDGAHVFSFDVAGPIELNGQVVRQTQVGRAEALAQSDIVITGVPSRQFELVDADELPEGCVCVNFSTLKNFTDAAEDKAAVFVPRVGPMTVTMALRNTLRLFGHYAAEG